MGSPFSCSPPCLVFNYDELTPRRPSTELRPTDTQRCWILGSEICSGFILTTHAGDDQLALPLIFVISN